VLKLLLMFIKMADPGVRSLAGLAVSNIAGDVDVCPLLFTSCSHQQWPCKVSCKLCVRNKRVTEKSRALL